MPAKQKFDSELAALESLRQVSPETAAPQLVKGLGLRNNLLVAKAAAVTVDHRLESLAPQLAAAFLRFLDHPVKSDPQCWAKNALVKALAAFGYQSPDIFLKGMQHVQLEPVWGGSSDTAATLRGTCALALVQCRELNSHRVLMHLTPLLADKEVAVQINAARAVEQVGNDSATLLLRLRAELGGGSPELLGTCYSAVLTLEGPFAISWVARFMLTEDDAAGEAALAIAQTHTLEAFLLLRERFTQARDPWFRTAMLAATALTRRQEAIDWLLDIVANDERHGTDAYEALCRSAPSTPTLERLKQLGKPL